MTQPIWYDSTETGAPTLNNVAGSLLDVLRACLIDGFNEKTVTSITVVDEVATVACTGHGFSDAYGKLVLISGATEPLLNGNKQPGDVLTDSFTFPAPGVADDTYTGTLSAKRAPLGWTEPHTGTNVAMFARSVPEATAMLLRVNDSGASGASATNTRILMVESATDVDTYTAESPLDSDLSGGLYWYKGADDTTAKPWAVVGDERFFWIVNPFPGGTEPYASVVNYFGDLFPYATPDAFACVLCGSISASSSSAVRGGAVNNYTSITQSYGEVIARGDDQLTPAVRVGKHAPGAVYIGAENQGQVASSPVIIARPAHVSAIDPITGSTGTFRGEIPGLAVPLARAPFVGLGQFATVTPTVGEARTYVSVLFTIGSGQNGNLLIDLTGPWYD